MDFIISECFYNFINKNSSIHKLKKFHIIALALGIYLGKGKVSNSIKVRKTIKVWWQIMEDYKQNC